MAKLKNYMQSTDYIVIDDDVDIYNQNWLKTLPPNDEYDDTIRVAQKCCDECGMEFPRLIIDSKNEILVCDNCYDKHYAEPGVDMSWAKEHVYTPLIDVLPKIDLLQELRDELDLIYFSCKFDISMAYEDVTEYIEEIQWDEIKRHAAEIVKSFKEKYGIDKATEYLVVDILLYVAIDNLYYGAEPLYSDHDNPKQRMDHAASCLVEVYELDMINLIEISQNIAAQTVHHNKTLWDQSIFSKPKK